VAGEVGVAVVVAVTVAVAPPRQLPNSRLSSWPLATAMACRPGGAGKVCVHPACGTSSTV
jgi:hypothetical protein